MGSHLVKQQPSPQGRGCPADGAFISRSGTGEGLVASFEWALFPNTSTLSNFFEADLLSLDNGKKIG